MVDRYKLMGRSRLQLESAVRYVAHELAPQGIRVHAISHGPIRTGRDGIDRFDELLASAARHEPGSPLADVEDVGALARFLVSSGARRITGTVIPVDGGAHMRGLSGRGAPQQCWDRR